MSKIGRNSPCPCKSGKKYKKCCEAADKNLQSQQLEQEQAEQLLPPELENYHMAIAIKPRPRPSKRPSQRRAPGKFARSGKVPRLTREEFPGQNIALTFMAAFKNILYTIEDAITSLQKAGHDDPVSTILRQIDSPRDDYSEVAYETVAQPFAFLRSATDTSHASTIDKYVRTKLDHNELALYEQLTQQRFDTWIFVADQPDYLTAQHLKFDTDEINKIEIDGFFSLTDNLTTSLYVAMPIDWNDHKLLISLGALHYVPTAIPYILARLNNRAPDTSRERALEDALLHYLLDPTPYILDTLDDYDDEYYNKNRPDIYDILFTILFYLNPTQEPQDEEHYVYEAFKDLIDITETKNLKLFEEYIADEYDSVITEDFFDEFDDFREELPLAEIHHLLGSKAKPAIAALKKAREQPAALLLDDDLLKQLEIDRLDTIKAVEKAAQTQKDKDKSISTRAEQAIHAYLQNYRMNWLLGHRPARSKPDESVLWADYTYELIMLYADDRFKNIALTQLPTTSAVKKRLFKAFGTDAQIADLPAHRNAFRDVPGIGNVTTSALLLAICDLFYQWPYTLAGLDPNAKKTKSKLTQKEALKTKKALDDIGKLFE